MIKKLLTSLIALVSLFSTAIAGDSAERRIIGFSPDAKWFAFEQFGIQDGSGFPYYSVFIIDLINDKWAPGTPVHVRLDDENATLHHARGRARIKAAPALAKLRITDRGRLLASNPVTEITAEPSRITFRAYRHLTGPTDQYVIKLEQFDLPTDPLCKELDSAEKGFALSISKGDGAFAEAYRDTSLPKSRGCANRYEISDVVVAGNFHKLDRFVVLVHVYSYGFEGPDTRFIAIPVKAP